MICFNKWRRAQETILNLSIDPYNWSNGTENYNMYMKLQIETTEDRKVIRPCSPFVEIELINEVGVVVQSIISPVDGPLTGYSQSPSRLEFHEESAQQLR